MRPLFEDDKIWKEVEKELLSWVGTPYRHHTAVKGRGVDCTLYIGTVLKNVGLLSEVEQPYYPRDFHRHSSREVVLENIFKHALRYLPANVVLRRVLDESLMRGDLLTFKTKGSLVFNHTGVYLGDGKFVSATVARGVCVLELEKWEKCPRRSWRLWEIT